MFEGLKSAFECNSFNGRPSFIFLWWIYRRSRVRISFFTKCKSSQFRSRRQNFNRKMFSASKKVRAFMTNEGLLNFQIKMYCNIFKISFSVHNFPILFFHFFPPCLCLISLKLKFLGIYLMWWTLNKGFYIIWEETEDGCTWIVQTALLLLHFYLQNALPVAIMSF